MNVLDLFSAAAGGWSLGMHRAGFRTVAACEAVKWRRTLYAENNPGVLIYDDVRTLTAGRLIRDLGYLPEVVVGSPPCQDISAANTKGKGVDGERSGLFFEAVRIIGEVRPRWFALENSSNLRTRGADAVLAALESLGYACWAFVVGAGDVGANHERKRAWVVGFDGNADSQRGPARFDAAAGEGPDAHGARRFGCTPRAGDDEGARAEANGRQLADSHARRLDAPDAHSDALRLTELPRRPEPKAPLAGDAVEATRDASHADQAGQADGCVVAGLRQEEITDDGRGDGWGHDRQGDRQVGGSARAGDDAPEPWADWNGGLADHLRLDDGLSAWLAGTRVQVGGPKGTAAPSLIVEAFGDAVVPQIPEAIGRAILRVERALAEVGA